MKKDRIVIPPVTLLWSDWVPWNDMKIDAQFSGGIKVPNEPSVYEVKYKHEDKKRLTIGKVSNLRKRIKQGLIKGKFPRSTGKRIRVKVDISKLVVRWTVTDRPAAVEEDLHRRYIKRNLVNYQNTLNIR